MKRLDQIVLIGTFLGFSWLAMQAVHELGHVLGARFTGGEVAKVVLHPCTISRTDLGHNPNPLAVVWAGPLVGAILPLLAFVIAKVCRSPGVYLFRFFAGFCLIANGVYIAIGCFEDMADAAVMLRHGSPGWTLILFGLLTAPLGLYLWHRQGPYFGLGEAKGEVSRSATLVSTLVFLAVVGAELIVNSR